MSRKYIECVAYAEDKDCSVRISAEHDDELVEAAVQHAVHAHNREDTPELRDDLRHAIHDEWRTY